MLVIGIDFNQQAILHLTVPLGSSTQDAADAFHNANFNPDRIVVVLGGAYVNTFHKGTDYT